MPTAARSAAGHWRPSAAPAFGPCGPSVPSVPFGPFGPYPAPVSVGLASVPWGHRCPALRVKPLLYRIQRRSAYPEVRHELTCCIIGLGNIPVWEED